MDKELYELIGRLFFQLNKVQAPDSPLNKQLQELTEKVQELTIENETLKKQPDA